MYIYKNLADLCFNNSDDILGEVKVLLCQDGEHVDVRLAVERQVFQGGLVLSAGVLHLRTSGGSYGSTTVDQQAVHGPMQQAGSGRDSGRTSAGSSCLIVAVFCPFVDEEKMATVTGGRIRHTIELIPALSSSRSHWIASCPRDPCVHSDWFNRITATPTGQSERFIVILLLHNGRHSKR